MEKQDKTFGSLTILDKVYTPAIQDIIFYKINSIEQTREGIKVFFDHSDYVIVQSSNTVAESHYGRTICVNRAKAVEIQQEIRKERLLKLQEAAQKVINELNEFSQKYF